ncbi:MAG: AI-2E family transporter [Patescibacteria group bacterium]
MEEEPQQTISYDISWMSIIRVIVVLFGVYLLIRLSDIFLILFIVLILNAALSPVVAKIKAKLNITRILAILLLYLGIFIILGIIAYLIIPPVIEQIQRISTDLPGYAKKIDGLFGPFINQDTLTNPTNLQSASSSITGFADSLFKAGTSFFGGIATAFYVLILTLFMLLEEDAIRKFFVQLIPISQKVYILEITTKISEKMGHWALGQLSLMGIIGLLSVIGYSIIGLPYALTLGVLAGLLELIPTIGPIIAAIPAVFVGFLQSPLQGVATLIFAIAIQQIENQFVVPKVMQKAIGVSPFIILIAFLVGSELAGILGALLAVPTVAIISVLTKEYPNIRKRI